MSFAGHRDSTDLLSPLLLAGLGAMPMTDMGEDSCLNLTSSRKLAIFIFPPTVVGYSSRIRRNIGNDNYKNNLWNADYYQELW